MEIDMRKFLPLLIGRFACSAAAQQSIEIDESSVTPDFDFHACRKAAKNLDQSLECTARKMAFEKKFYSDGTLRSDDPSRGERKWQEYLDQRRSIFLCENSGRIVVKEEAIFVQQNKMTGEYVITSESGELRYTPRPGDLCRVTKLD